MPGSAPGGGELCTVRGGEDEAEHSPHSCALGTPAHLGCRPGPSLTLIYFIRAHQGRILPYLESNSKGAKQGRLGCSVG